MKFTLTDLDQIIRDIRRRLRLLEVQGNSGVVQTGLAADRPATPNTSPGTTTSYYAYNTKVLSVWNINTDDWDEVVLS